MYALLVATLAGLCTGIGSAIAFFIKHLKAWQLALILGFSAGVMVYVSFAELLANAVQQGGLLRANIGFFVGFAFIALLDLTIPHQYEAEHPDSGHALTRKIGKTGQGIQTRPVDSVSSQHSSLKRTGLFTALGIAIHNLPEGLAVFAGFSTGNAALGLLVATAIALHNVPEGIAVSIPIKEATGSSKRAFLVSFASGTAEPIGALLGYLILSPFLTPPLIAGLLAFAAGIMIYISLDELIPAALQYGTAHLMILGLGLGMLVMATSVVLIT
jgi:zinc transporter, ZIP family